jgi:hypothetical protein
MKKEKIPLDELQLDSFITSLQPHTVLTVQGGDAAPITIQPTCVMCPPPVSITYITICPVTLPICNPSNITICPTINVCPVKPVDDIAV